MSNHSTRRRVAYLSLFYGALAVIISLGLYGLIAWRNDAARAQALRDYFVGTWATDGGVILQLRADGSALVRYHKSPSVPVSYFRWEISSSRLLFINSPRRPKSVQAVVHGWLAPSRVVKEDIDRFDIVELTTNQSRLIALPQSAGQATFPMRWTRTDDTILDMSP